MGACGLGNVGMSETKHGRLGGVGEHDELGLDICFDRFIMGLHNREGVNTACIPYA